MSGWPTGNFSYPADMHVLTDSLIVNTEEEPGMDSNDDIKVCLFIKVSLIPFIY